MEIRYRNVCKNILAPFIINPQRSTSQKPPRKFLICHRDRRQTMKYFRLMRRGRFVTRLNISRAFFSAKVLRGRVFKSGRRRQTFEKNKFCSMPTRVIVF